MNFFYDEINNIANKNASINGNLGFNSDEITDESEYIYGKLNKEVEFVKYKGATTQPSTTNVDNTNNSISVDVIKVPHRLPIQITISCRR